MKTSLVALILLIPSLAVAGDMGRIITNVQDIKQSMRMALAAKPPAVMPYPKQLAWQTAARKAHNVDKWCDIVIFYARSERSAELGFSLDKLKLAITEFDDAVRALPE